MHIPADILEMSESTFNQWKHSSRTITYQAITEGQLRMNNLRRVRMLLIKNGQNLDVVRRWIGNSGVAEEIIGFYDQKQLILMRVPAIHSGDVIYLTANST